MRKAQTSVEYLLLVAGVLLITVVAGMYAVSSSKTQYSAISGITGAPVTVPSVVLRESEVPTSAGSTTVTTPASRDPPVVSCSVSFSATPPVVGETATFTFTATDVGNNLDRADLNVYINGAYSGGQSYSLSGGSDSGTYTRSLDVNGSYKIVVVVYDKNGDYGVCDQVFSVGGASIPPPTPSACLEGNVDFYITDLNVTPWLPGGAGYALGTDYTISFKVCRRSTAGDLAGPQSMYVEIYDEAEPTAIVGVTSPGHSTSFNGCGTSAECYFPNITLLEKAVLNTGECKDYTVTWRPTKGGQHRIVVKLMDVDIIHSFVACGGFDQAYLVGGILKCADEPDESSCTACGGTWWNGSCVGCIRALDANCSDNMAEISLYAGLVLYFHDCNEITYYLSSDIVKNAVQGGEAVSLIQANDIVAEPNPDGSPREACIYASNYDYKGLVTVYGQDAGTLYTVYIGATTGEYNAHRAVLLENAKGLRFEGMHFDCASKWKIVRDRQPCVELSSSDAELKDSTVEDFGSAIPDITTAIPIWLRDSTLTLDGTIWLVAVDDTSISPLMKSYSDTLFVLEGASQFQFGSSPSLYIRVYPDS